MNPLLFVLFTDLTYELTVRSSDPSGEPLCSTHINTPVLTLIFFWRLILASAMIMILKIT